MSKTSLIAVVALVGVAVYLLISKTAAGQTTLPTFTGVPGAPTNANAGGVTGLEGSVPVAGSTAAIASNLTLGISGALAKLFGNSISGSNQSNVAAGSLAQGYSQEQMPGQAQVLGDSNLFDYYAATGQVDNPALIAPDSTNFVNSPSDTLSSDYLSGITGDTSFPSDSTQTYSLSYP